MAPSSKNQAAADPAPEVDPFLKTADVMSLLNWSRTKVWDLVMNHGLPAYKVGGDFRYRRSEVLKWMEQYRFKPPVEGAPPLNEPPEDDDEKPSR